MKENFFIILLFILPVILFANFQEMNWGAAAMAMGNAYSAMVEDPTTIFWNPARMGKINKMSIIVSHQNMFGIKDFYNEMAAIVVPMPYTRIGIGWTQMNLTDVYKEQLSYLSTSSIVWIGKTPIRFGFNLKHFYAKANYDDAETPQKFDIDLGIDSDIGKNTTLSFVTRNVFHPNFSFISKQENLPREFVLGFAYHWKRTVNFSGDYVVSEKNELNLGMEYWFFQVFAPRIGLRDEDFTIGLGLQNGDWQLDAAVLPHKDLGSNYRLSLVWKFDVGFDK